MRRDDVASAYRAKEVSEKTKRSWSEARSRRSCAAECRDFTLRDWTEHSPAGIAKIEACTCPVRKGRVFYASSRSSYSLIPFSSLPFRPFALPVCSPPFCLPHSKLLLSRAFLSLGFVSEIRSSSFSSCPFRHASLFLSPSFLLDRTLRLFSPSCVTLLFALLSVFFSLHAVWPCTS